MLEEGEWRKGFSNTVSGIGEDSQSLSLVGMFHEEMSYVNKSFILTCFLLENQA